MADNKNSAEVTDQNAHLSDTGAARNSEEKIVAKPQSWKSYVWDTWELPAEERRLLFKVDAFVLTFASLGYFLKNIDQTNVNNAFLSGMKEDLSMYGNELVTSKYTLRWR